MRSTHKIALCIPAYNAAVYLPRLLKAAHAQQIPFDEILVYNDCSKDDTSMVAKNWGATVIEGDINRGCSFGKNKLAEASACDWLHFHDADDDLYSNFTTLAQKWIKCNEEIDIVLFDFEYRDYFTNELLGKSDFNDRELQKDAIRYAILNQINNIGIYRRKKFLELGGFNSDPETLYNEDVDFHCKMAIAGCKFRAEKKIGIIINRVSKSMSSANQLKCAQAHFQVMQKNAEKVGHQYAPEIAKKLWNNAIACASLKDIATGQLASELAYRLDPKVVKQENFVIQALSKINPFYGIMFRERLIRLLKPHLR